MLLTPGNWSLNLASRGTTLRDQFMRDLSAAAINASAGLWTSVNEYAGGISTGGAVG
jgi:hypothetical protein